MIVDQKFLIEAEDVTLGRLDRIVLRRFPETTRTLLAEAFAQGAVTLNGVPAQKAQKPQPGAVICVKHLAEARDRSVVPEEDAPLCVCYEDNDLVAVDKPHGQSCHPLRVGERRTLAAALLARYPEISGIGNDPLMPGLLHRIDAGTSGLVLAARNADSWKMLREQFTQHTARKIYMARVEGSISKAGGVSGYLAHCTSFRGRMRAVSGAFQAQGEKGLFAETFFRPVASCGFSTLLEVTIYTGVTHQIRCQLASIGHPILGDATYGAEQPFPGGISAETPQHCLHAYSATFLHPRTRKTCTLRTQKLPDWASTAGARC